MSEEENPPKEIHPLQSFPVIAYPIIGVSQNPDQVFMAIVFFDENRVPKALCQLTEKGARDLQMKLYEAYQRVFVMSKRIVTLSEN